MLIKQIVAALALLALWCNCSSASEITGNISTDPGLMPGQSPVAGQSKTSANNDLLGQKNSGAAILIPSIPKNDFSRSAVSHGRDKGQVLGIKAYPDGSLIRGSGHRIYLIEGKAKKQVLNLKELQKYKGQPIYRVTDEILGQYQDKPHPDGDLIRAKNSQKVYVVAQGKKRHILSIEELRAHFRGREIFNISTEEIDLYKEA